MVGFTNVKIFLMAAVKRVSLLHYTSSVVYIVRFFVIIVPILRV